MNASVFLRQSPIPHLPLALCIGADPELFHPASSKPEETFAAKRLCFLCPELSACAAYAISDRTLSGVWGGLSFQERKDARRRMGGFGNHPKRDCPDCGRSIGVNTNGRAYRHRPDPGEKTPPCPGSGVFIPEAEESK